MINTATSGGVKISTPPVKKFEVKRTKAIQAEREARRLAKQARIALMNEIAALAQKQKEQRDEAARLEAEAAEAARIAEQRRFEVAAASEAQLRADFKAWMKSTNRHAGNPARKARLMTVFLSERTTV